VADRTVPAPQPWESGSPAVSEWRCIVADAAHDATVREAEERWQVGNHPANYRWTHVQTVVRLALRLAELTGADREVVEAAAWLHDIAKRGRDDDHGYLGSLRAREILSATDYPPDKIDAVADAIARHVGLWTEEPVTPLEAAVLWDADKLTKLGVAAGMQDIAAYVLSRHGAIDDLPYAATALLYGQTVDSFHTAPARAAGRVRLEAQSAFWRQVARELVGDDLSD